MGMSQAIGGPGPWLQPGGMNDNQRKYKVFLKESDLNVPGPANVYVLLDEHPDSINAGGFGNTMVENPNSATIVDFPSSYHNGAAGISFADGHAELHTWRDGATVKAAKDSSEGRESFYWAGGTGRNPDFRWVWDRYRYVNWKPLN